MRKYQRQRARWQEKNKLTWHSQAQAKSHSTNIAKTEISPETNLYTENIKKKFM